MKVLKLFIRQRRGKVALTLLLLLGQSVGTLLIPALVAFALPPRAGATASRSA